MKMMMQRLVVVVAVVSVMVACSSIAQAKPDFGADCSNCHGSPGGALDVLPSSLIEIEVGTTGQVTFDVTDVPSGDAALALSGLDDANLMATVGTDMRLRWKRAILPYAASGSRTVITVTPRPFSSIFWAASALPFESRKPVAPLCSACRAKS